ncbi:RluA family pseudouridine synthase [Paenibacillus periandrae]|uniref:RluA family pseudouridine synthase n=1 Tax=Paenibacillus periandrae TaxID=1761741 RepID=UPI001F09B0AE|nr:RluA family pseudouridine synthase [Paenibacillus periandrae]
MSKPPKANRGANRNPRPANKAHISNKQTTSHKGPSKPIVFKVAEPAELLTFLLEHLSNMGRNSVKSILARGQVSVNDRTITTYNFALMPGHIVSISKDKSAQASPILGLTILHEDEDLIVINKDSGILSVSATHKEDEVTAYRQLTMHVREENPRNRIFIVHRLDRDTSGVMVFAKSEKVQQTLQNAWQDMVKERSYTALVEGKVRKIEGTITSWLKESSTLKMYSSQYPNDGQQAITHYRLVQTNGNFSLLDIHLETGRKNQIRVHMEDIGHPVVGDKKYGSKSKIINRLGLHARVLAFIHPTKGELLRFETAIPKMFLHPFRPSPHDGQ